MTAFVQELYMLISILVPFHSFIIIIIRFLNFISKSTVLYCILHLSNPISALLERKKEKKILNSLYSTHSKNSSGQGQVGRKQRVEKKKSNKKSRYSRNDEEPWALPWPSPGFRKALG